MLQWLATQSCSAVLLVANVMTSSCSSGGKTPGPTGARSVLQTREAMSEKACSPKNNGIATAIHFIGDLHIRWLINSCQPQDEPATKYQRLRRGMGAGQRLETILFIG